MSSVEITRVASGYHEHLVILAPKDETSLIKAKGETETSGDFPSDEEASRLERILLRALRSYKPKKFISPLQAHRFRAVSSYENVRLRPAETARIFHRIA